MNQCILSISKRTSVFYRLLSGVSSEIDGLSPTKALREQTSTDGDAGLVDPMAEELGCGSVRLLRSNPRISNAEEPQPLSGLLFQCTLSVLCRCPACWCANVATEHEVPVGTTSACWCNIDCISISAHIALSTGQARNT